MDKSFTFAIDVDEVLRDNLITLVDVYNKEYGDNKTVSDITEWDVDKVFPRIKAESGQTAGEYFFVSHAKEVFSEAKAYNGAVDAIKCLRKYGKIIIVTYQKNAENQERTLKWLEKNGIEYDGLCFLKDKTLIHADFFIDDNDWNFAGCNCRHGIMISQPYNSNVNLSELRDQSNCKTIDRFSSIKAFADWFEKNINIFEKFY